MILLMTENLQERVVSPKIPWKLGICNKIDVQLGRRAVVTHHDTGITINNSSIDGYRLSVGIDESIFNARSMQWEEVGGLMSNPSSTMNGPKDAKNAWPSFDIEHWGTSNLYNGHDGLRLYSGV